MDRHRAEPLWVYMPNFRSIVIGAVSLLAACSLEPTPQKSAKGSVSERPIRIVSLVYCADQFVLKLADRSQIVAVSPDATKSFSYMRSSARGVPVVRSRAEDVIALKPDLVVRSYGGGPNIEAFLRRSGIKVAQMGYSEDFDGVRVNIRQIGQALGQEARAKDVIAEMDARLSTIATDQTRLSALYLTPSGVTSGSGSLVDVLLRAGGYANFEQSAGWKSVSLERLAREAPDLVAFAAFNQNAHKTDQWSSIAHPVAQDKLRSLPVIPLEGAWTACGGWFLVDAVEALAAGRPKDGSEQ